MSLASRIRAVQNRGPDDDDDDKDEIRETADKLYSVDRSFESAKRAFRMATDEMNAKPDSHTDPYLLIDDVYDAYARALVRVLSSLRAIVNTDDQIISARQRVATVLESLRANTTKYNKPSAWKDIGEDETRTRIRQTNRWGDNVSDQMAALFALLQRKQEAPAPAPAQAPAEAPPVPPSVPSPPPTPTPEPEPASDIVNPIQDWANTEDLRYFIEESDEKWHGGPLTPDQYVDFTELYILLKFVRTRLEKWQVWQDDDSDEQQEWAALTGPLRTQLKRLKKSEYDHVIWGAVRRLRSKKRPPGLDEARLLLDDTLQRLGPVVIMPKNNRTLVSGEVFGATLFQLATHAQAEDVNLIAVQEYFIQLGHQCVAMASRLKKDPSVFPLVRDVLVQLGPILEGLRDEVTERFVLSWYAGRASSLALATQWLTVIYALERIRGMKLEFTTLFLKAIGKTALQTTQIRDPLLESLPDLPDMDPPLVSPPLQAPPPGPPRNPVRRETMVRHPDEEEEGAEGGGPPSRGSSPEPDPEPPRSPSPPPAAPKPARVKMAPYLTAHQNEARYGVFGVPGPDGRIVAVRRPPAPAAPAPAPAKKPPNKCSRAGYMLQDDNENDYRRSAAGYRLGQVCAEPDPRARKLKKREAKRRDARVGL